MDSAQLQRARRDQQRRWRHLPLAETLLQQNTRSYNLVKLKHQGILLQSAAFINLRRKYRVRSLFLVNSSGREHILVVNTRTIIETSRKTSLHISVDKAKTMCSYIEHRINIEDDFLSMIFVFTVRLHLAILLMICNGFNYKALSPEDLTSHVSKVSSTYSNLTGILNRIYFFSMYIYSTCTFIRNTK